MSQLPQQPWNEGDTFTNDATGVEYTFDGVKWLASGGEELDLSGFLPLSGGEMEPSAQIKVNNIAPVNTASIKYDGSPSGHPMSLMNRGMISEFIDEKTEDFASVEYVDNADRILDAEIQELALALNTLLAQRDHGQWEYVGLLENTIPRSAGQFALQAPFASEENVLILNSEDLNGTTHALGTVKVGDYVEVVDLEHPDDNVLYVVTDDDLGSGTLLEVSVSLRASSGEIKIGDKCEVRFFAINQEDISIAELDARYLKLTGGTLTGTLNAPRIEAKKLDGEAIMLIEGKLANTNSAARLTFSNKTNANAYGSLTWQGTSGTGWFAFNKDLDMGGKGLHSIGRIRLIGDKTIQEAQSTRIRFSGKVEIPRTGDNKEGFVLKGKTDDGNDQNLLYTYHNSIGLDAVNYAGKQDAPTNLANVGYVDDAIANIPEVDLSGYVSKSGDEITGQLTIKKSREVALDIVGDGNQSQIKFWSSGAVALQNYTSFKDNELVTKKYVDDAVSTNQGSAGGSLLSHTERLLHTSNGTNGKQFYFWNEHSAPTDGMNNFRRFKWKLPSTHYLSGMAGAGNGMGFLVIQSIAGNLLYQCQISRAEKSGLYIDLHLDHETHYGSSQLAYGSYFIVSLYSCLRERL